MSCDPKRLDPPSRISRRGFWPPLDHRLLVKLREYAPVVVQLSRQDGSLGHEEKENLVDEPRVSFRRELQVRGLGTHSGPG